MNFSFYMPVKIVAGADCILQNKQLFQMGKKCLLVTGKHSAKLSGALADVCAVLQELNIAYEIYDKITENPLVSTCYEGGQCANQMQADFIIGIGGGSPLDASKAIAAYAANPTVEALAIYTAKLEPSLPILAIPTTAGTGSEANPYAVMSLDGQSQKKTFTSPYSYPKYAFLDPKYTASLGEDYTISTAIDAFCHCIESFLSPKATDVSELFALYGAKKIWDVLINGKKENLRQDLLYASCAAGIAINTSGTGFPHPLGYNLTFFYNIPHGRACGAFIGEYVAYNSKTEIGKERLARFCAYLGITSADLQYEIPKLANVTVKLEEETILMFIEKVKHASNYKNSPYVIQEAEMKEIYQRISK